MKTESIDINPADSKSMAVRNEQIVISLLRRHGQMSQAQLCNSSALSSSTASYIVGRLRQKGLIIEKTGKSSKPGAKPVLISINPAGCFAVGVEIAPGGVHVGLFDFNYQLVDSIDAIFAPGLCPEKICNCLEINLKGLLGKNGITEDKLTGIGVAVSGSITGDGTVVLSSPMGWKNVRLKQILQARFESLVTVCTTRVRLLAELAMDSEMPQENVLYLNIADGVGSHAIIDGKLLLGSTTRAGEIGHIIVDPDGPTCGCGHKGCLETLISGPAIAKTITGRIAAGARSILKDAISPDDMPEAIIEKWAQAISQNDAFAIEMADHLAVNFSRAATVAINFYDPETVILGGYVSTQCFDILAGAIKAKIPTDVFDFDSRAIEIRKGKAGKDALVTGAARTAFQQNQANE